MNEEKIVNLLSIAQCAGRVASGDTMAKEAFASHKARSVLLTLDAAEDTKKLYRNMAEKAGIPVYEALNKEELGHALGKAQRATAILLDRGFSEALKKRME